MEKFITLKKGKRAKKHGFMAKMATHNGKKTMKRRRDRNRLSLAV